MALSTFWTTGTRRRSMTCLFDFRLISLSVIRFSTIFNLTGWRGEEVNSRKHSIEGKRAKVSNIFRTYLLLILQLAPGMLIQLSKSKGGHLFEGCGVGGRALSSLSGIFKLKVVCLLFKWTGTVTSTHSLNFLCKQYTFLAFNVLSSLKTCSFGCIPE